MPTTAAVSAPAPTSNSASSSLKQNTSLPTELLASISIFSKLSSGQLSSLAAAFVGLKTQEGIAVAVKGMSNDAFYIVADGQLVVSLHDSTHFLTRGDYIGLSALFEPGNFPFSVVPKSFKTEYKLDQATFIAHLQANPDLTIQILSSLSKNVLNDKLSIASTPSSKVSPLSKMTVRIFDNKAYQKQLFISQNKALGLNYDLDFVSEKLTAKTAHMAAGAQAVCVFVHDTVDEDVAKILKQNNVDLVAFRCAGFDTCNVDACDKNDISVVRVPSYSPNAIAEHAVALMMAINRKLILAGQRVHTGDFSLDGLVGFNMKGKTVGVIGTGKIGFFLIQIMLGFGCRVICYDVFKNPDLLKNPAVTYVELDQLYRESDIISLHAPLTPETQYMINKESISKMKKGVLIINTARGGLIDTKALIQGLIDERIGGCGLDVVEEESDYFFENVAEKPIKSDIIARLLTFNNVMLTSHQAYLTHEALSEIASCTLKNIEEFQQGKRLKALKNSVNKLYLGGKTSE